MIPLAPLAASAVVQAGKALAGHLSKGAHAKDAHDKGASAQGLEATNTKAPAGADKARKTADDFETMFLEQSLDRLTASDGTDGPMGENGAGGGVYRSMMSQQYAAQIAKTGGIGISDQVYGAILKMQEAGDARAR